MNVLGIPSCTALGCNPRHAFQENTQVVRHRGICRRGVWRLRCREPACPLDHAVMAKQLEVVEVLLAKGADRQGHAGPGRLLQLAISNDGLPIAQMLFKAGTRPDFNDNMPATAAEKANAPMLAWLYQIGYPLPPERDRSAELMRASSSACGACVASDRMQGRKHWLNSSPMDFRSRALTRMGILLHS